MAAVRSAYFSLIQGNSAYFNIFQRKKRFPPKCYEPENQTTRLPVAADCDRSQINRRSKAASAARGQMPKTLTFQAQFRAISTYFDLFRTISGYCTSRFRAQFRGISTYFGLFRLISRYFEEKKFFTGFSNHGGGHE